MGDQKNLFLAIGLSIAIILIFSIFFPQQTIITPSTSTIDKDEQIQPSTSIDQTQNNQKLTIKNTEEILASTNRVLIDTPSLKGSINLKGGILDNLKLINYKESLEENSNYINLFSPDQTTNPYFIEIGWKSLSDNNTNIHLPDLNTEWKTTNNTLSPSSPVTLYWTNNENITFKIEFRVDEDYIFEVTQEIENKSNNKIEIFPYRLIKRINLPDTINFFILHEGLISLLDDELLEKKYKHLSEDCSTTNNAISSFCNKKATGGWFGFTDKYWMSALIPNQNETINVNFRHSNNGRDNFRVGYAGQVVTINPNTNQINTGKIFAGAKVLRILNQYQKQYNIPRFNDAIDWGWFSFLTKPIFYSINWFYGLVGNFGVAILAFTALMRLILFPLAHTSFKSMAKMKKLQPEMQRLKETYPDDRQKMQQELMALYKKEGANPVAGCLPIFAQIPIFFSLYKVLFVTIEMYHAPFFGWLKDLSAPDPLGLTHTIWTHQLGCA